MRFKKEKGLLKLCWHNLTSSFQKVDLKGTVSRNFRRLCGQKLYLGQYEQTKTVTRNFRLCEGIREKRLYVLSLWIHGKLFYFSKVKQIKATQHLIWYSVRWLRGHTNIEFCNEISSRKRKVYETVQPVHVGPTGRVFWARGRVTRFSKPIIFALTITLSLLWTG